MAPRHLPDVLGDNAQVPQDRDTIITLRDAAASNSLSLTHDARLLLLGSRWAGAYALATLAVEEAGKAWLCQEKLLGIPGINKKRLRTDHVGKSIAARQMLAMRTEASKGEINIDAIFGEHHDYAADDAHYLRLLGLYVDLTDSGVAGGASSIDADTATGAVHLAIHASRAADELGVIPLPEVELGADTNDWIGVPIKPPAISKSSIQHSPNMPPAEGDKRT
jgi:AbiV family abortive infection protein